MSDAQKNSSTKKSSPAGKIALFIGVVLALFIASQMLPVEAWLKSFNQWIFDLGAVGLSNYFYGLTAVKFWPYVLASWIGMMPGTLAYVYFGTLGRAAAQSASDAGPERGPLE